jgi:hypothetical protein
MIDVFYKFHYIYFSDIKLASLMSVGQVFIKAWVSDT